MKLLPAAGFALGLLWDSLTLTRIDTILDNVIMMVYLALIGLLIVIINLIDKYHINNELILKYHKWYPTLLQFFFGGLFSGYAVFYFQSSTLSGTAIFFVIIIALLVANEFLENKYSNFYLQFALYFLANFTFFIFFIPVITKSVGFIQFMIAGAISLAMVEGVIFLLQKKEIFRHYREKIFSRNIPVLLFVIMTIFYINNWIPPVPLSLKYSGAYHNITRTNDDANYLIYELDQVKPKWYQPFKNSDSVLYKKYEKVTSSENLKTDVSTEKSHRLYFFSSVFAPTLLKTTIYHNWQRYNESKEIWEDVDRIKCEITGGRETGYRGISFKQKAIAGLWRVGVTTEQDQLLGETQFTIKEASADSLEFATVVR